MGGSETPMASETVVWRIFLGIALIMTLLLLGSITVCATNSTCLNHIPTAANMLNSTFTMPFIVSGVNAALGFHLLTSSCLYYACSIKSPYWSKIQMFSALLVYFTCIVTLFVLPFTTGWPSNWANITILCALSLWMMTASVSIKRGLKGRPLKWNIVSWIFFCMCVIIYIVIRAVPLPVINKDAGLLTMEILGFLSFVGFMLACLDHIWKMSIQFNVNLAPIFVPFTQDDNSSNQL